MNFFRNKHVVTAMIVAPLLAVLAYFAVDMLVKEQPHVAVAGEAYPLLAKSNCRFSSGQCDLKNASFNSTLRVEANSEKAGVLTLSSSHALQIATVGFVTSGGLEIAPSPMLANDQSQKQWSLDLPDNISSQSAVRVALQANDAFYFAETELTFANYQTSFEKDFRKQ